LYHEDGIHVVRERKKRMQIERKRQEKKRKGAEQARKRRRKKERKKERPADLACENRIQDLLSRNLMKYKSHHLLK
jgi:hypothetical protein